MQSSKGINSGYLEAFLRSENQMGFSVVTLLAWLALSDGEVSTEEREALKAVASNSNSAINVELIIQACLHASPADLQLACEVVRHLKPEGRQLFLEMAIGVALKDRVLAPAENHILRFYADILSIGSVGLRDTFRRITTQEFPLPSGTSNNSKNEREERSGERKSSDDRKPSSSNIDRIRALAILGLEESANREEIKDAYRRLARIHHPDRFSSLGEEAVAAATRTFQRIESAHRFLAQ
jgi:DnaJ like chaperone protein